MSHIHTHLAAAGRQRQEASMITPPVYPSATYRRVVDGAGYAPGKVYSRDDNPGYRDVESLLARLEGGAEAALFASGMAACSAAILAAPKGAHFVVPRTSYVGVKTLFAERIQDWGYHVRFYDNADRDNLCVVMQSGPVDMLWVETPSNPLLEVTDVRLAAEWAQKCGAALVVDNTVPTPLISQPLALGADYVVHSCSKALNGHHDVIAGAIVTKDIDAPLWSKMVGLRCALGGVLGPFEAWLLLRGLKTLHLRVPAACRNAERIASFCSQHPKVEQVLYPGLTSHRDHDLAARQMCGGYGALLSILVRGGARAALHVVERVRHFQVATSLGGTESLIEHRATVEDYKLSTPEHLLRIAMGIEHSDDLIQDLDQALSSL